MTKKMMMIATKVGVRVRMRLITMAPAATTPREPPTAMDHCQVIGPKRPGHRQNRVGMTREPREGTVFDRAPKARPGTGRDVRLARRKRRERW